jgi:transcriptional antiterminator RfaH
VKKPLHAGLELRAGAYDTFGGINSRERRARYGTSASSRKRVPRMYWTVAQVKTLRERFAQSHLERLGFPVYLPRIVESRRNHSRRVDVVAPLFPGYCFFEISLQWAAARSCPGVVRLVMDGMSPAKVPDAVLAEIRAREVRGLVELPKRRLMAGDRVRILAGPFRDHIAALDCEMNGAERVAVLLYVLGAQHRTTLPRDHIEAATGL